MPPTKPTAALIAEGTLWGADGLLDCPGTVLPAAADTLRAAMHSYRVVVITPCAATREGARRCQSVIESLGLGLGTDLDLHVSFGFPVVDAVIASGVTDPAVLPPPPKETPGD